MTWIDVGNASIMIKHAGWNLLSSGKLSIVGADLDRGMTKGQGILLMPGATLTTRYGPQIPNCWDAGGEIAPVSITESQATRPRRALNQASPVR